MVVCQYFLRGHCRYGDKCWNEHPKAGGGGAQRSLTFGSNSSNSPGAPGSSQFKWVNPSRPAAKGDGAPVSPADLVMALPTEMQTWHKSGMWPFSSIALERAAPSLPEFEDLSPEELRVEAYSAQQSSSFQKYVERVKQLSQEWSTKKQQLVSLTPDLKQKLVRFVEEGRARQSSQSSGPGFGGSGSFGVSATPGGFGAGGSTAGSSPFALPPSGGAGTGTFGSSGTGPGTFGSSGTGPGTFGSSATGPGTFGSSGTGTFGASGVSSSFGGSSAFGGGSEAGGFGSSGMGSAFGSTAGGGLFGKSQGAAGIFGGASAGSAFGAPAGSANTPASGSGGFGSQPGAGLFGKGLGAPGTAQGASGFGVTGTGSFGAGSGGIFGAGSGGFGAPSQPAAAAGTSLFGKPTAAAGLFSAPSSSATGAGNAPGSGLFSGTSSAQPFGIPPGTGGGHPFGGGGVTGTFGGMSGQASTNQMIAAQQPGQSGAMGLFGGGLKAPTQETQPRSAAQLKKMETLGEVSRMFTPMDEASPEDLEQFMAPSFSVGKIPMIPPPRELINH